MSRAFRLAVLICIGMTNGIHYAQESAVKIDQQKAFNVIGLAVRTNNQQEAGGQGEIPRLWQRFMQQDIAGKIPNRAGQNLIVVNTDYESDQNGENNYFIGVLVTSTADVPAGLTLKEIPSGSYAVLESEKGPAPVVLPKIW